ncbi:MAG TPA: SRPBCC family protein [Candidatus Dormibacteraeota bacterium]|nr:SRPBCC family protein [Candidatus Dormibacteraeota bacterium]
MSAKAETMAKAEYVIEPGKQEIIITRVFDAPRELVFKAYTDPILVPQWFGPREYTTIVDKMEARPGGLWRFVQRNQEGDEFAFHGVHHDIVAPERIVATFEFEGVPGHVLLQTLTLEPQGQKTRLVEQLLFQSVADRDGMVASGMQRGSDDSMDRMAEILEDLKAKRA